MISACGLKCNECPFYEKECDGCYKVMGKTFWAKDHLPEKICPLFDCSVNNYKFSNCGECSELPCQKFDDLKDPNSTDEEHKKSILDRVNNLKKD